MDKSYTIIYSINTKLNHAEICSLQLLAWQMLEIRLVLLAATKKSQISFWGAGRSEKRDRHEAARFDGKARRFRYQILAMKEKLRVKIA